MQRVIIRFASLLHCETFRTASLKLISHFREVYTLIRGR